MAWQGVLQKPCDVFFRPLGDGPGRPEEGLATQAPGGAARLQAFLLSIAALKAISMGISRLIIISSNCR